MKAMILAAGQGQRLRPLTLTTPKALVPVAGKALIVHHLQRLSQNGITEVVINLAYLGDKIAQYLGNGQAFGVNIAYSREEDRALETGGGIVNALPLLGDDTFICINSDIFTDYPFKRSQLTTGHLAHVVLTTNPTHVPNGDFAVDQGQLSLATNLPKYTFAGIAWYHPNFFANCQQRAFSVAKLLQSQCQQGLVSAEVFEGQWHDIGTLGRLKAAEQQARAAAS